MELTREQTDWLRAADNLYDDEIKPHHAKAAEFIKDAVEIVPTLLTCRSARRRCQALILELTDLRAKTLSCDVRWSLQLNDFSKLFPDAHQFPRLQRALERTAHGLQSARNATQDAESALSLRLSQAMDYWTNMLAVLAIVLTALLGGVSILVTLWPTR